MADIDGANTRKYAPSACGYNPDQWTAALSHAVDNPTEPRIIFQPIVDLQRGSIAGYEALARFSGARGQAPESMTRRDEPPPPDHWFAAAREAGVAAVFEARVLRAALRARDRLPDGAFLTVNVFADLLTHPEVAACWRDADLRRLVLELNEAASIDEAPRLAATLAAVRDRGAQVAMDDVGSGYAGLLQVTRVRPEMVKLDRDLVNGAVADPVREALTELVGSFATRIDALVIAEGVERVEDLDLLVALGVQLGQGWLLGRPAADWARLDPAVGRHIREAARHGRHGPGQGAAPAAARGAGTRAAGGRSPGGAQGTTGARTAAAQGPMLTRPAPDGVGRLLKAPTRRRPGLAGQAAGATRTPGAADTPDIEPGTEGIIVDRHGRPVGLELRPHPDGRPGRRIPASLLTNPDEPLADVVRRAMTRPPAQRFDPVVVVADTGRPLGAVRVDELLLRLADLAAGGSARTGGLVPPGEPRRRRGSTAAGPARARARLRPAGTPRTTA